MTTIKIPMPTSWGGTRDVLVSVGPKPGTKSKKVTHLCEEREVYVNGSIDEFCALLQKAAEGLTNTRVDMKDTGTYEESYNFVVTGWREMTAEELEIYRSTEQVTKEQREAFERRQFEDLKRNHPEWIKDELK